MTIDAAVDRLQAVQHQMDEDPPAAIERRDSVLEEYQPVFQPNAVGTISEAKFREFLLFENNRHWTGLHRQKNVMTADMDQLREGLEALVDEERDLAVRVQEAKDRVDGMGKATLSAILVTAYPDTYGVWNNSSEEALKQLDVWPEFERGSDFGQRYERVNGVLQELGDELELDLWELDSLLGYFVEVEPLADTAPETTEPSGEFVKERHLQQYLVNNWERMDLSEGWEIYSDADDPEAGVEFSTGIGRPDLLLTHDSGGRVCVLELKKGTTSDRAVGQLLRYVGWVRQHLPELEAVDADAEVEGRLVVSEPSDKLEYAISAVSDMELYRYEMEVSLVQARPD